MPPTPSTPTKTEQVLAGQPARLSHFMAENRIYLFCYLGLVLLGIYLMATQPFGEVVFQINTQRTPERDRFFVFITQLAEHWSYISILLFFILFRWRTAIFMLVLPAVVGVTTWSLKILFSHPRPLRWFYDFDIERWGLLDRFDPSIYANSWAYSSFPSGHAMSAFALFSFLAFNVKKAKIAVGLICLSLAFMVAFSRMYLLMHFVKDITFGSLLGVGIGVLIFHLQFKIWPQKSALDRGLLK